MTTQDARTVTAARRAASKQHAMKDSHSISTAAELAALGHELRLAVLRLLVAAPATNQQLAQALGEDHARLWFHVVTLHRAGLIDLEEERPKLGVVEKYYRAAAREYRLDPELLVPPAVVRA
jgi:DNA-binding transcriptional ArsR family regulator